MLTVQKAQTGFKNLVGVDYSESAVILAKAIANSRKAGIAYKVINNKWDIAIDWNMF